jgi:hypothetical protein
VNGQPVAILVSEPDNLIVSYLRTFSGEELSFEIAADRTDLYPFGIRSTDGTVWSIVGAAVSGPRSGMQLSPTLSYNSYWFAWAVFLQGAELFAE